MVIDDDYAVKNLLEDSLKAKGYTVISASRGREAIQKMQNTRPDLILLDAMLPEIHGFTICKTLKQSEKYRAIPVIIITAVYTGWRFALDVKEQYGADEVIEKPFLIKDVLEKIKVLLRDSNLGLICMPKKISAFPKGGRAFAKTVSKPCRMTLSRKHWIILPRELKLISFIPC